MIVGRAIQFLLALAMMRVATTLLSPEEMGKVSLVLTTIAFFALFLINPVGVFINRRLLVWQANGVARHYLIRYVGYLSLVALIAAIALPLIYKAELTNFGISIGWLIVLICGSLLFNTANQTVLSSLNFLGEARSFVILSVATIAASFICATLLVEIVHPVAQYWLLGQLLGQTLLAAVGAKMLFACLERPRPLIATPAMSVRQIRALAGFAWPVAIAAGLGWVQGQGYRYLLEGQLGLAPLGLFVAGYGISAGMISAFESVLTTYFQPRLYRDANAEHPAQREQAWQRYATAVVPSLLLTVALVVMLAPELTRLFLGAEFQVAAAYLVWGALAEAARVLVGIYSMIAHVYMRTHWLIIPNIIGAALATIMCVLLIPAFGAAGAGIGLVVSGFAVVATMHVSLAPRAGGGIAIRPVMTAGMSAVALWGATLVLRDLLLGATVWVGIFGVLVLVGAAYLGLQYLFLREHLMEKGEA